MKIWAIRQTSFNTIMTFRGVRGGEALAESEVISDNGTGRSLQEQIELKIKYKIAAKLDRGYCTTEYEASKILKPRLAKVYDIKTGLELV